MKTPYYMTKPKSIGGCLYDLIIMESIEKVIEKYEKIKNSPSKKNFIFDEDQLNSLGYQMIKEMKLNNATKLFELNLEEYPNSASAYQGLGDAYLKCGQIALAIENYKKSVELNPDNENAKKALKKLKKDSFSMNLACPAPVFWQRDNLLLNA